MNTEKWTRQLDEITEDIFEEFGELTEEQLNWKPNPDTWSVAQNLHHLMVINETYYPVLERIRANTHKTPWLGRFGFVTRFLGNAVLNSVHPDRRKKMKTFPIWEPSDSHIGGDILDRFEQQQHNFKQLIESCRDLPGQSIVISSPANKNIVYTLETAFDIIVLHERRHVEQAKELLQINVEF